MASVGEVAQVRAALAAKASERRRLASMRFFKTGPGDYGEGDVFIGVSVPDVRAVVKLHRDVSLETMEALLASAVHEERLAALLLMVDRFQRTKDVAVKRTVFDLYMRSLERVNNWDLVDTSAPYIVGAWLATRGRKSLRSLARSPHLWSRRVAMLASFHFIKAGEFDDVLALAELLVDDEHDLMHKAVGWMLREMGERGGRRELLAFLGAHVHHMPRTMLRYAIEKLSDAERKKWLSAPSRRARVS
jgi:3-methyladenine DNA glycosylase AlkD